MRKTFQYRLYPTKKQTKVFTHHLDECRWLYNHLLEQRKVSYENLKINLSLYDQQKTFVVLKESRPSLKNLFSQILTNVSVRVDLAFQGFFRRIRLGEKPGYPRFRKSNRYNSFSFPQLPNGCDIRDGFLRVSKVGKVKIVIHRKLEGIPKIATIVRYPSGKWFVNFICDIGTPIPLALHKKKTVGIDVGLTTFASLSSGLVIKRERFLKKDEKALTKASRRLTKAEKGTPERAKRRKPVSRIHERIKFRRYNFAHQWSRKIINKFGIIFIEDLQINRMIHNTCLAKNIYDASWTKFFDVLIDKAEEAGRKVIKVNPAYTSQTCSSCGHRQDMPLSERVFICSCCKTTLDRDYNASLNILALGLQSMGSTPDSLASAKK